MNPKKGEIWVKMGNSQIENEFFAPVLNGFPGVRSPNWPGLGKKPNGSPGKTLGNLKECPLKLS